VKLTRWSTSPALHDVSLQARSSARPAVREPSRLRGLGPRGGWFALKTGRQPRRAATGRAVGRLRRWHDCRPHHLVHLDRPCAPNAPLTRFGQAERNESHNHPRTTVPQATYRKEPPTTNHCQWLFDVSPPDPLAAKRGPVRRRPARGVDVSLRSLSTAHAADEDRPGPRVGPRIVMPTVTTVAETGVAAQVARRRQRRRRPRPTTALTGVLMWTRDGFDQGILALACSI
jgi:hypothetical protein